MNKILKRVKNLKQKEVFLLLTLVVMVFYWGVWDSFFQQDEWAGLGGYYSLQHLTLAGQLYELYRPMLTFDTFRILPFVPFVNFLRYESFGLDYSLYSLLSLSLHIVSSYLVFVFLKKLTKNKTTALAAGIFFAIAASASQAVTWVGTSVTTQFATIFTLFTLVFWTEWIEKDKRKSFWLSMIFLFLATGFKETSYFLFFLIPVSVYIFKPKHRKKAVSFLAGVILLGISATLFVVGNPNLIKSFFSNYLSTTIRGSALALFPSEFLIDFFEYAVRNLKTIKTPQWGTTEFDLFLQNELVLPFANLIGLALISVSAFFIYKKKRNQKEGPFLLLAFIFSFIPLSLIPNEELTRIFLAPRNLYLPLALGVIFFAYFAKGLSKKRKEITLVFLILFFAMHVFYLRQEVNAQIDIGSTRKNILMDIQKLHPDLPEKIVFYTESDTSYYGLPEEERILPFQSGFGQTLLVWYQEKEEFPSEFFEDRFLWEITEQGYKEVENRGFGYFRDFEKLKQAVEEYNIPSSSIIAFSWKSEEETLIDLTDEVRERL